MENSIQKTPHIITIFIAGINHSQTLNWRRRDIKVHKPAPFSLNLCKPSSQASKDIKRLTEERNAAMQVNLNMLHKCLLDQRQIIRWISEYRFNAPVSIILICWSSKGGNLIFFCISFGNFQKFHLKLQEDCLQFITNRKKNVICE